MKLTNFLSWILVLIVLGQAKAQNHLKPGNGNPIIPGYFADPTVKKFGDTYYIYATTDGNGGGFGPPQVWMSKDFVNWSLQDMNWPKTHYYWAPDVTQANDGKYYLYYCQPVEIFGASSDTPIGPWTPLLPEGKSVVPNFLVPNVITLDGQTFKDDDGKMYLYWGTWGIYPKHGAGVGLLNRDMKSFAKLAQIPNTDAKDFFEASFMFKRMGIYYFVYSSGYCEDGSYRVQYATSKVGPMGPFTFGKNNPILATNADETVHGPGHQSVLQVNNDFYLIYHRHNNPHNDNGYHRQVAADKMEFDEEGNIKKITPTHSGIGFLGKNENPHPNLAYQAKVNASSFYDEDFKPDYAVDDNNGTLWKAKSNAGKASLTIDLGGIKEVKNIQTQFEYATWYYQYVLEYSNDQKKWKIFADKSKNTQHGSPMVDLGDAKARYIRLTILNTEYPGLNRAVWNIKVFSSDEYQPIRQTGIKKYEDLSVYQPKGLLVDLDANAFEIGQSVNQLANKGVLKGSFIPINNQKPVVQMIDGRKALAFTGKLALKSDFRAPLSLKGNSSFSVAMWVLNPEISKEEPILSWTERGGDNLTNAAVGYGDDKKYGAIAHMGWPDMAFKQLPEAGKWHHLVFTFDGTKEKIYVDGKLDREGRRMLFIKNLTDIFLGTFSDQSSYFSGALANIKLFDTPLNESDIANLMAKENKANELVYLSAATLQDGDLIDIKNNGLIRGHLKVENQPAKVEVFKGTMAIFLQKNQAVKEISASSDKYFKAPFHIALHAFANQGLQINLGSKWGIIQLPAKGTWASYNLNFDGKALKMYVNGQVQSIKKSAEKQVDWLLKPSGQAVYLAEMIISNQPQTENVIAQRYKQQLQQASIQLITATFKQRPVAATPEMIMMEASVPPSNQSIFQYQFTETNTGNKSNWLDAPDYIKFGALADKNYSYTLQIRNQFGFVSKPASPVTVNTYNKQFSILKDESAAAINYKENGVSKSFWDGFTGEVDEATTSNGQTKLLSTNTFWDGAERKGPFLYKKVDGDFIAEVKISDLSGLKERKPAGANDVGLMVRLPETEKSLIQNSVLLGWGVGNMTTNFDAQGRRQLNNGSGFSFYPYLQIQRLGNLFYLRGSADGKTWKDLPSSPVKRTDWNEKPVEIGIYQCTYGDTSGYGIFEQFRLVMKK